ncbi:Uncharacterised protein [Chromobacterium violaceum]|uniref:Uncharacterized protein n=1 Tax=Chromobacterium violaceum TaxID=536 RepID=A0A3S4HIY0_CHRVL|nr:Uncharacterised protein [Chromobacterium violaceum]
MADRRGMKEQTSEQASFYHLEAFDGLEMLDAKYHLVAVLAAYALCSLL